jgi:hypothetical protein
MLKKGVETVVSCGANIRLDRKRKEHGSVWESYSEALRCYQAKLSELVPVLEQLDEINRTAIVSLKRAGGILRRAYIIDDQNNTPPTTPTSLSSVNATIAGFTTTANGLASTGAGAAAGLGTWSLVSLFGTASTGTMISSLSGIAAHNATLAWLGGGALAVGGGGMAAGAAVMASIMVFPALIINGALQHRSANKKIEEIGKQINQINEATPRLLKVANALEHGRPVVISIARETECARVDLDLEYAIVRSMLYRIPILSRVYRLIRYYLTGSTFADNEQPFAVRLDQAAGKLVQAMDRRVFNDSGDVIESRAPTP